MSHRDLADCRTVVFESEGEGAFALAHLFAEAAAWLLEIAPNPVLGVALTMTEDGAQSLYVTWEYSNTIVRHPDE